ncbi:MAG: (2Fe-2S)-binding protein [Bryobacterales bacterium]|nr:(2Fe-2S)-binding protein [Bryobacterales bacterium]
MREQFEVRVNREAITVDDTTTVAAAILRAGVAGFRQSPDGHWRGPLCGMGICAECRATIDGVPGQYTCQRWCRPGMQIVTGAASDGEAPDELEER